MSDTLSEEWLSRLREFIAERMGLYFPVERRHDLERGILSAAQEFHFPDSETFSQWLLSSPLTRNQIESLAGHLTIGETYFFREKRYFEILEEHFIPELIRTRRENERRLRIWSAGCCTGEEPYSIAILLYLLIPKLKDWNITILATDINPNFLKKAVPGMYGKWSFRNVPAGIIEQYFYRREDGRFEILPDIKKMVIFSYLNLAEDSYPSLTNDTNAMDMIFCRNVLMYFAPEKAKKVIQNLYRSLVDGGWLIVSSSELSQHLFSQFKTVHFADAIVYRKDEKKSDTPEIHPWLPPEAKDTFLPRLNVNPTPPLAIDVQQESPESFQAWIEGRKQVESSSSVEVDIFPLYQQGRYQEVEKELSNRWLHRPGDPKEIALLARTYANQGKLQPALEWCEKAIEADRINAGLYYLRATILQELGKLDEAVASLKRTLYLDPKFVLAYFAIGHLHRRQGKIKESRKQFENVLSLLHPYSPEEVLPESEGITAKRLREMVQAVLDMEEAV